MALVWSLRCVSASVRVAVLQEEELTRQQRKEAAEAQRAAERHAAQQKRDEEAAEKLQLLVALRAARKAKADELGQVCCGGGGLGAWLEWVGQIKRGW